MPQTSTSLASVELLANPPVSVVLPTLDEQSFIRDCLDSLLAQDYSGPIEILVVDGGSSDATRQIVGSIGGTVRLVDNPRVTAAAAMNIGLREASNHLIVRADAHTLYAPDYVRRSVEALAESGADWVGGTMRPAGTTAFGRSVGAVTSSPVGVGPGRFHYATEACDVETVYLGTFDRRIVDAVGGYDEDSIQRAAEDQELAYRLRLAGRRIRLVPTINSWYFPRETPRALWRQYFNYGMCKASTLAKHRTLPYWRPLAPAILIAALFTGLVGGGVLRRPEFAASLPVAYASTSAAIAVKISDDPGVAAVRSVLALWICHIGYGLGFWNGLGRILRGAPFDARPRVPRASR